MTTQTDAAVEPRLPLSRERVLRAAVALADRDGIEALSMRKLGQELGVEAMSLYNHVANKEDILNGIIDVVMEEIETAVGGFDIPADGSAWKETLRGRILAARAVMLRHRWAPEVLENTAMSPIMMRYFDTLLGVLISGGMSYDLGHHAMHALGSRALGFNQELFKPDDDGKSEEEAEVVLQQMAKQLPHITAMMMEITHEGPDTTLGWCDDQTEFEFGLDLVLNGLEQKIGSG